MKTTEILTRGALDDHHLTEMLDQLDPAIGEAASVMGAMATEVIRRSLRGGVLQLGRELSGYVGEQVEQQIIEQRPAIEKTAALTATEVAHGEVDSVRQTVNEQGQQLAARIEDGSRQAQEQTETVARDLTGRLDESSRQTRDKIETMVKVIDDTARQSQEATSALARTLETEVAAAETRTLDTARKELEAFRDRARQATAKIKERLDKLDAASTELADLQRALKLEMMDAWKSEQRRLVGQIDELRRANVSLAQRLEILERPRGVRAFFAWLFGKNKNVAPAAAAPLLAKETE